MESSCAQYDLTWSSWHTWCAQKNTSNPRTGSNLAVFGAAYEVKRLARPACSHRVVRKPANFSALTIKLTLPVNKNATLCSAPQLQNGTDSLQCRNYRTVQTICSAASTEPYRLYAVPQLQNRTDSMQCRNYRTVQTLCYSMYNMLWVAGGICTLKV